MIYPLLFKPIFKERVWGGRQLEKLYRKELPADKVIGESWEISDRPGDVSVIANGPLAGKDLRWLIDHHADEVLGAAHAPDDRFPLLIKILDAQDDLSLQVHPPAAIAGKLGGEPKTEMWYITHATPKAALYAGLKHGVSRTEFEEKLKAGTVAECFHRLPVKEADALFLPSGRVHAIGAGNVIFEIQQNSDTTYRVFDWNRVGLDGKPRDLHIAEAMASIDFNDFEPPLIDGRVAQGPTYSTRALVSDVLFKVYEINLRAYDYCLPKMPKPQIIGMVEGRAAITSGEHPPVELRAGQFCLIPACCRTAKVSTEKGCTFLLVDAG